MNWERIKPIWHVVEKIWKKGPFYGFMVALLVVAYFLRKADPNSQIEIHPTYISFALIGVVFHLMSQYRKLREKDGFDWGEYWFDYLFRAFQACVYVVVIENLVKPNGELNMALLSLFVGMYIRRVEAAFEDMGDRFGDMLKGILGTSVQRLSPVERRKRLQELQNQLIELKKIYQPLKPEIDDSEQGRLDGEFSKALSFIQKDRIEAAETSLLHLDFAIKDLQLQDGTPPVPPSPPS